MNHSKLIRFTTPIICVQYIHYYYYGFKTSRHFQSKREFTLFFIVYTTTLLFVYDDMTQEEKKETRIDRQLS